MRVKIQNFVSEVSAVTAITQKFVTVGNKVKTITRKCADDLSSANGLVFDGCGFIGSIVIAGISSDDVASIMNSVANETCASLDYPILKDKKDIKQGSEYAILLGIGNDEFVNGFRPFSSMLSRPCEDDDECECGTFDYDGEEC